MADLKPEELVPEIADGVNAKFQRNLHIFSVDYIVGQVLVKSNVGVSKESKMAACIRKGILNNVYLS